MSLPTPKKEQEWAIHTIHSKHKIKSGYESDNKIKSSNVKL